MDDDRTPPRARHGGSSGVDPGVWMGLLLLLATASRLATFFAFPAVFDFVETGSIHGSVAYDRYARNLLATRTYGLEPAAADAALPPVYSFVLAGAYSLLGRSALSVAVLHTALDLGSLVLLVSIGGALLRRPSLGLLAGLGFACYPYLLFQGLTVNDTSLFILELHLFVWLLLCLRDRIRAGRPAIGIAAFAGATLGLGILTRPVLIVVAVAGLTWLVARLRRCHALPCLVLLLGASVPLGVWSGRNLSSLGRPIPIATNGGSNFWQGNNPATLATLRAGYDVQWIEPGELGRLDARDPESGRRFVAAALRFLSHHPESIPELLWTKLRVQWSLDVAPRRNPSPTVELATRGGPGLDNVVAEPAVGAYSLPLFDRLGRSVHRLAWGGALILACVGSIATRRQWRDLSLVVAVEAAMTAFYVLFHPSTRYRLPGDPLLFLLSAAGALALLAAARRHRGQPPGDSRPKDALEGSPVFRPGPYS